MKDSFGSHGSFAVVGEQHRIARLSALEKRGFRLARLPYALRIASKGYEKAAEEDPGLAEGINLVGGNVTNAAVAESLQLTHQPLRAKGAA